ncbi:HEPN domain-containing protein [Elongatibacter sediminis]|uniref:HEPN domain-containing protein n=1 Tax=Elongatibacter sediminis TaxID=3119006 RepID=A0AAW9RMA6_9GAMM
MRIPVEHSLSGNFWLATNEGRKVPGNLTVRDGGSIELEILEAFNETGNALFDDQELPRICGLVEKEGFVTLENCFFTSSMHSFGVPAKSVIHVGQLICGVAYEKNEQILLNSFCFSVEGLDEWIGLSGISTQYHENCSEMDIKFRQINKVQYVLPSEMKLEIAYSYNLPGPPYWRETTIKQKAHLVIKSETPRQLSEFQGVVHRITNLLSLAIDETVAVDEASYTSESITDELASGKLIPRQIKLIYPSISFLQSPPRINFRSMLFRLKNIKDFNRTLKNWFEAYDVVWPSLGLYFNSRLQPNKYNEGKFLALAQGVESLHRRSADETHFADAEFDELVETLIETCPDTYKEWLKGKMTYANEIPLRKRLTRVMKPFQRHFGNAKSRSSLIAKIVDTRNYFTHWDESLKSKAASSGQLYGICLKLEAMLQLSFLAILGFDEDEIDAIVKNNHRLSQKLRL